MFEKEYDAFWKEQVRGAEGQRLEMLKRDLSGTKKRLEKVVVPVLGTFKGIILEHEMVSLSGVKIYGDALLSILGSLARRIILSLMLKKSQGIASPSRGREHVRLLY